MRTFIVAASIALISLSAPVVAQSDDIREALVRFDAGSTVAEIEDTITGYQSVSYTVGLEAGRRLSVKLDPTNTATYFNIYEPGRGPGDEALANSGLTGDLVSDLNRFESVVQTSGTYTISVYMMRSAARRNETTDYVLSVELDQSEPSDGPVQADYADGLQGGPDFWQVNTSSTESRLNVREAPSISANVVSVYYGGQTLRNLGCRMAEGRRWCNVETPDGSVSGWAAGDFLIEGAAPDSSNSSEPKTSTKTVNFAPGTSGKTITDRAEEGEAINYVLGAREGQFLNVTLRPDCNFTHFNIFMPGDDLLYESAKAGNSYRGQLYLSGDHTVTVYYLGGNGSASIYDIDFAIE